MVALGGQGIGDSSILELLARLLIGGLFLMAGLAKLGNPRAFRRDIAAYRLLPMQFAFIAGYALPPTEILAGVLLLGGIWIQAVALAVAVFVVLSFGAALSAIVRRLNISCGCFGLFYRESIGRSVLTRDAVIVAMAAFVAAYPGERLTPGRAVSDFPDAEAAVVLVGTGWVFIVMVGLGLLAYSKAFTKASMEGIEPTRP